MAKKKKETLTEVLDKKALAMSLQGKSHVEIAKALGHKNKNKDGAEATISRRLGRVKKSEAFTETMERLGLTNDLLIETAKEGLKSTEIKLASFEGRFTDERVVPDNAARRGFADLVGKWKGLDKVVLQNPDGTALRFAAAEQALDKVYGGKK